LFVSVDTSKCSGHGRCHAVAPEFFTLDDDGFCDLADQPVPPEHEAAAVDGERNCPERAITVSS
jgi:ferredoxin